MFLFNNWKWRKYFTNNLPFQHGNHGEQNIEIHKNLTARKRTNIDAFENPPNE